jgi:hypothetical protein
VSFEQTFVPLSAISTLGYSREGARPLLILWTDPELDSSKFLLFLAVAVQQYSQVDTAWESLPCIVSCCDIRFLTGSYYNAPALASFNGALLA